MKPNMMNIRLMLFCIVLAMSALSCAKLRNEFNFSKEDIAKKQSRNVSFNVFEADSHKCLFIEAEIKEQGEFSLLRRLRTLAELQERLESVSNDKDSSYLFDDGSSMMANLPFERFYWDSIVGLCKGMSVKAEFEMTNEAIASYRLMFQLPVVNSMELKKFNFDDFHSIASGTSRNEISKIFGFRWDSFTCAVTYQRKLNRSNASWRNVQYCIYHFNVLKLVSKETKSNWLGFNSVTSVYRFTNEDGISTYFTFKDDDLESVSTTL